MIRPRKPRIDDTIGVVVVTHTQAYLEECLESVDAQSTLPADVIVVDNGSDSDRSAASLAASLGHRTVRLEPGVRLGEARNVGCQLLSGCDLIVSLDGDDLLLPSYLDAYRRIAADSACQIVFGSAELFGSETGLRFTRDQRPRRPNLRKGNFIPANSMFTRDIWARAGGFDPTLKIFEDWDFWLSCAEIGARYADVTAPLWRYRRHEVSMLSQAQIEDKDAARSYIWHKHVKFMRGPLQWRRAVRKIEKTVKRIR